MNDIAKKYEEHGGCSISNPFAPPPISGSYGGDPEERSFWAMLLIPEDSLNEALITIKKTIGKLQSKYNQTEMLVYYHQVNRLIREKE